MSSKLDYISDTWKDGLFGIHPWSRRPDIIHHWHSTANKVVFCTGGAGTICSAQVRALVYLGADACIVGRNVEKTESVSKDIATVRPGAKVIGVGAVDVRKLDSLNDAVERCVNELGGLDFAM